MIKIENLLNSEDQSLNEVRKDVLSGFELTLEAVNPYKSVINTLKVKGSFLNLDGKNYDLNAFKKIRLIAFGKASIKMAEAILSVVDVDEGIVVGVEENNFIHKVVKYIKGGHPIPDENSFKAGEEILKIADSTDFNDLTFVLISGGGSALVESSFISLERLQNLTKELLKRGANINELNAVRKHLSKIKGGKLLKRIKGTVVSLIISDVVSDPLDVIASGPTYFDSSTFLDAYRVLEKYNLLDEFDDVPLIFKKGIDGLIEETLKENEKIEANFQNVLVASNSIALKVLKKYFEESGYTVFFLGSSIEGLASEVAKVMAGIGKSVSKGEISLNKPVAVVFGGETTVIVKGKGIGGRNSELTLHMAKLLKGTRFVFSSIGTDGIDGVSPACGAIADSETLKRANKLNLDVDDFLNRNDSFTFFNILKDAIITGPTGTNVADIATLVIL